MIVVIIAGGSGTRLWPLSTSEFPKHLLSLTNEHSLLQNTCRRVERLTTVNQIFVVSEASHAQHVAAQLPEIPKENLLIEPGRRGTAACFLLAMRAIRERQFEDQAIFFLWADNVIRDNVGFSGTAITAAEIAETRKKMVFIGVEPLYPSTGLGYMKKGDRLDNEYKTAFELVRFVEKPDHETAKQYFNSGTYLWNTGYLMAPLSVLEREIEAHNKKFWDNYQDLLVADDVDQVYLSFNPEAIEYALSEKVDDAIVVSGTFDWLDIGSFADLHEANGSDESGNHVRGTHVYVNEVENAYIRNEERKPVAVIGLDNIAVINTPHGVLVTRKDLSQKVKDIVSQMKDEMS